MGYKLIEVEADGDFAPLIASYRDGFGSPGNALWPLFTGDYRRGSVDDDDDDDHDDNGPGGGNGGDGVEAEAKTLAASRQLLLEQATARFLAQHRADQPRSTWLQVVDEASGAVAAGGKWVVFERGGGPPPYEAYVPPTATWYPEGAPRELAMDFLRQFLATRVRLANGPHVFLNILWTHPEHRGKGCARLVMNWGLKKADELGLETFLEATREGKPVYEAFGFETVEENHLEITTRMPPASGDDALITARMLKALTPFTWWSMRRPASVQ